MVPQVTKLVRKKRLADAALCRAAREVLAGKLGSGEADLGGGLFKKRVARSGGGKSGGYRVIIAYRQPREDRVLFAYAFAKNVASTLSASGQEALTKTAKLFVEADDGQIAKLLASDDVVELECSSYE